ncbi:MAG: cofactor-independent phosphoglycerate mutase [Candidatus Omnitrophica bacterium]|nr:cofactor-independent phosphoglycerate mutase [Candidatus Omnitrophota bacterium]
MKYIIIVPDGMADQPLPELDGKTPLEVAATPHMDYIAQNGMTGLVQTIPEGMIPGSDVGNMSLLGYDPRKYMCGRAPLEAASMGLTLNENQVALRCNLVTVSDGKMRDYSAGHILTKEAAVLIKELGEKIGLPNAVFYAGKSYRHLLIINTANPREYAQVRTVPPHDILDQEIKTYLPAGSAAADVLLQMMEKSWDVLVNHPINKVRLDLGENPANMIWLWGQGMKPALPLFHERYGVSGAIISAVDLVNGIGKLVGLQIVDVPGITGYYDTNFSGKAQYALEALRHCDFVFIHIEAPDEAGHNGDWRAKVAAIENIDREIVGRVLNQFSKNDDARIMVLPDHPTPVGLRTHTGAPVGYTMMGKDIMPMEIAAYNEKEAAATGKNFESGEALMEYFMQRKGFSGQ